jgi:hypothetical protein
MYGAGGVSVSHLHHEPVCSINGLLGVVALGEVRMWRRVRKRVRQDNEGWVWGKGCEGKKR